MNECQNCREPIEQPVVGRPRKWCSERCRKAGAVKRPPIALEDLDPVSPAVADLLEHLRFAPDDPRTVAGLLLRQLTSALDTDPGNIGLAREIRQLLAFLSGVAGSGAPGEVDIARVGFLLDRLQNRSRS